MLIHANAGRALSPPKWQLAPTMLIHATGCVSRSVSLPPGRRPGCFGGREFSPVHRCDLNSVAYISSLRPVIGMGGRRFPQRPFLATRIFSDALPRNCRFSPCRRDSYVFKLGQKYARAWYALRDRNIFTNTRATIVHRLVLQD